jgi:hypothetical protein
MTDGSETISANQSPSNCHKNRKRTAHPTIDRLPYFKETEELRKASVREKGWTKTCQDCVLPN